MSTTFSIMTKEETTENEEYNRYGDCDGVRTPGMMEYRFLVDWDLISSLKKAIEVDENKIIIRIALNLKLRDILKDTMEDAWND